jgi:hypothetical protein
MPSSCNSINLCEEEDNHAASIRSPTEDSGKITVSTNSSAS